MKTKTIKGWVVWTRDTTPMEADSCYVYRSKVDAIDDLKTGMFGTDLAKETWRVSPVTMTCEVPVRPAKAKKGGKRGKI